MWSITFKLMKRSMRMLVPAGIAIIIGTMFVSSTFLFGNALDHSLRQQVSASFGDAQYAVSNTGSSDAEDGRSTSETVASMNLDRIREIQGVSGVRPDTVSQIEISGGSRNEHSSTAVIGMANSSGVMPVSLASGLWPAHSGEIAVPESMANLLSLHVGDTVKSTAPSGGDEAGQNDSRTMTVVGISKDTAGAYAYYGGAAIVVEQDFAGLAGFGSTTTFENLPISTMFIELAPATAEQQTLTLRKIDAALPHGFQVKERKALEDSMMKSLGGGQVNITTTFILAFGVLAMFVAAIVIANTFQVMIAQRRRTLALLRTIGARKSQLYASVLVEASILGLVCSVVGVGCALLLMTLLGVSGVNLAGAQFSVVLSWPVFVVPILFGMVITILASSGSARAATGVTPLEALQPMEASVKRRHGWLSMMMSLLLMLLGVVAVILPIVLTKRSLTGESAALTADQSTQILGVGILGVMMFFVGVLLCSSRWMPWLLKGVGALLSHIGPATRIASANIQKNPRRVASTGAALLIGVTLVSCLGTGAASAKQTMSNALDARYSVDIQVTGNHLTAADVNKVKKVGGVHAAGLVPTVPATLSVDGQQQGMSVYELSSSDISNLMHASVSAVQDGDILVPKALATGKNGLAQGSKVTLGLNASGSDNGRDGTASTGTAQHGVSREFRVVGANYRGVESDNELYGIVKPGTLDAAGIRAEGNEIWISSDGQQNAGTLVTNIKDALSDVDGVNVGGSIAVRSQWEQIVNVLLMILVALLAVAVVIALIGVANTLSLSVIERLRESATLRAIGMTRGQLRASLAIEALLISGCSVVVGLVLGTVFGWIGSYLVFAQFGAVAYPLDWGMDAAIVAVAVVSALLASVLPAKHAVSTSPVEALAEA
ncbi:MAG: ABC transporter permease [Bifidobacterium crudilactis]|uniref:ABC transporter permease n=1 Tax=Bifidobacterium crudilactis TaxID=327277 RepID=UPI003F9BB5A1